MSQDIIFIIAVSIAVFAIVVLGFLYYRKHYVPIQKKAFYDDGALRRKYYLLNGVTNGEDTFYYPTGEINKIQQWNQGKLEGSFVIYYKNGNKYITGNYVDGVYNGEYIVSDINGNVLLRKEY